MIIFSLAVTWGGSLSALPFLHLISVQNILLGLRVQGQQMALRWHIMNYMPGVYWCWAGLWAPSLCGQKYLRCRSSWREGLRHKPEQCCPSYHCLHISLLKLRLAFLQAASYSEHSCLK